MSHHAPQPKETAAFDPLDSLLNQHFNTPAEQLAPSSGFAASIMEAVHQHAIVPPPIPFPWRRALFGLASAVSALIAFLIYAANNHTAVSRSTYSSLAISTSPTQIAIASSLLAIALSAAAVITSVRLAGRSN